MGRQFTCPQLSKEEYEAVCVPWGSAETRIHEVMKEHGYCIIPDVISPTEAQEMEALLTKDLIDLVDEEEISQMSQKTQNIHKRAKENGIIEWPMETLQELYSIKGYLCRHGLAHSSFGWNCRFRVRKIYEILHGMTDLVTGFDTIMASNGRELEAKRNDCWPHVDRSEGDPRMESLAGTDWEVYQSILYLWSSESSHSSTTVVWPGSHKDEIYGHYANDSACQKLGAKGIHFSQLFGINDAESREFMYQGWLKNARRVTVPAGGLVIWSSKLTHQGWAGGPRLAQPICWEPRERRSEEARRRKMLLAALGLPSTHWASLGKPHGHRDSPEATDGIEFRGDSSTVGFPLKASINCYSLKDGVDPVTVWNKLRVPHLYSNNDEEIVPEAGDLAALDETIRSDVKDVL